MGCTMRAHNVPPGMPDARSDEMNAMLKNASTTLNTFNKILQALNVNEERALEELTLDWTASQEIADVLMRQYKLPFRVGHHFASEMVGYARGNNILPLEFPYSEARRIYREAVAGHAGPPEMPMSEAEFKAALNPVVIVQARTTKGGPQPAEMTKMLGDAQQSLAEQKKWIADKRGKLADAEKRLNSDFEKLFKKS
jgi:argininosuccinate lyase